MANMIIAHPGAIAVHRHTYGTHSEQFGELRLPPGGGPHPAIVYLHGGGWQAGVTLAGATGIVRSLTAQGYVTWNIEYRRLGNGGGWPATFEDVLAASAYLKTLAGDAPIDLSRVFVAGQSAGGQLALWLASRTTGGRDDAARARLPGFRGVLALAPATDRSRRPRGAGDDRGRRAPGPVEPRVRGVRPRRRGRHDVFQHPVILRPQPKDPA